MEFLFDKEELIRKVKAGEGLTEAEDVFYLNEVLKVTGELMTAENMLAIASNKDPNLLID